MGRWARLDPDYSPTPYAQFAAAFTNSGHRDAASDIRYLSRERERDTACKESWLRGSCMQQTALGQDHRAAAEARADRRTIGTCGGSERHSALMLGRRSPLAEAAGSSFFFLLLGITFSSPVENRLSPFNERRGRQSRGEEGELFSDIDTNGVSIRQLGLAVCEGEVNVDQAPGAGKA